MVLGISLRRGELDCFVNNTCQTMITNDLRDFFNFVILSLKINYTFHTAPELYKRNRTEWDLLTNMLLRNRTNILFTPTVSDGYFPSMLSCTNAIGVTETLIISKSCQTQEVSMGFLLKILSTEVWMSICLCLFTVSFLSYLEEVVRRGMSHQRFTEHFWFNICSLLQKPYKKIPNTLTSRILNLNWVLALLILFSAYSGNMKTSYIVSMDCNVNSFEDIVKRPHLVPIMSASSPSYYLTKSSNLEITIPLFNQLNRTNGIMRDEYYQPTDILRKVMYKRGVFIENTQTVSMVLTFLSMMSQDNKSSDHLIHVGTTRYFTIPLLFHINKFGMNPNTLEQINSRITRYIETGHKMKKDDHERQSITKYIDNHQLVPKLIYDVVKLRGLVPVFRILFFGIEVSAVVCCLKLVIRVFRIPSKCCRSRPIVYREN